MLAPNATADRPAVAGTLNSMVGTEVIMDETRCKKRVWKGWHDQQCRRNATMDGYCKQHHPDTVEKRKKARAERWEEKRKKQPWYLLQEAHKRIAELEAEVTTLRSSNKVI